MASSSLQTLLAASEAAAGTGLQLSIIVADNTPGGQHPDALPPPVQYWAFPENPGLAQPYNLALQLAGERAVPWLLTLDQDTKLPTDFLTCMAQHASRFASAEVGAIVPRVVDSGRPISPFRFVAGFWPRVQAAGDSGVLPRFASAINSASLLRVSALQEIGGYDPRFPLNNSDTSLFHRLDAAGKRLVLAGDVVVGHELAILSRADRTTPERYRRLLLDESDCWDLHMSAAGRAERFLRLGGRILRTWHQPAEAAFRQIALQEMRRRVVTRRSARIHAMQQPSRTLEP